MTKQIRFPALVLAGALGATLFLPSAAHASSEGRKNTAIALGAAALGAIIYGATQSGDHHHHRDWDRYDRYDRGYGHGSGRYGGEDRYGGYGYSRGGYGGYSRGGYGGYGGRGYGGRSSRHRW